MAERVRTARDAPRAAEQPTHHFGAMLREFRESYFERISRSMACRTSRCI